MPQAVSHELYAQAAQALSMNHTRRTIGHRIIRVHMNFLNKNGLPYFIRVVFAPGVVILQI